MYLPHEFYGSTETRVNFVSIAVNFFCHNMYTTQLQYLFIYFFFFLTTINNLIA